MMTKSKSPAWLIPLLATVVAHLLLIGLLYWLTLRSERRVSKPEEIVLIDLGDVAMASGSEEPAGGDEASDAETMEAEPRPTQPEPIVSPKPEPKPQAKPQPTRAPQPKPAEPQPTNTQQYEESLRKRQAEEAAREAKLAEERAKQEAVAKAKAKAEAEAKARAEREAAEREAKRRAAGSSVAKAFGGGKGTSTSQGNATGSGNQGASGGSASGSFSLDGRRIVSNGGRLTPPKADRAIAGRIVVSIVVDSRGNVTSASVSPRGTSISDATIRAEAIRAARATSFDAQEGAESQKGTITYIYIVKD